MHQGHQQDQTNHRPRTLLHCPLRHSPTTNPHPQPNSNTLIYILIMNNHIPIQSYSIDLQVKESLGEVHSMQFKSLNGHFPMGVTKKCLHSQAPIQEEPIRNTEVAEDSQFQALQPDLRIAEDNVVLVIAHTPSFLLQLEG